MQGKLDMSISQKKCPMCAEEIPLTAATCEYCGAHFEITSTGYCQNCHQVREADENSKCKVCCNAVMDWRVESKFIEEPVQKQLPVNQPIAHLETTKTGKGRLPIGIIAGIVIFTFIGAVLGFGRKGIPAVSSLFLDDHTTATATFTSTMTATTTLTPTRTPHPTPTATPIPTWVIDFANPILAAIEDRKPDFADDFSQYQPGWQFHTGQFQGPENPGKLEFVNGVMRMSVNPGSVGFANHPRLLFNDFVFQVDADLQHIDFQDALEIDWRGIQDTGASDIFELWRNGRWYLYFCGDPCISLVDGIAPIKTSGSVTITIISRGTEYAIYLNSHPLMFFDDVGRPPHQYIKLSLWVAPDSQTSVVEYDNLKVWGLENFPKLP